MHRPRVIQKQSLRFHKKTNDQAALVLFGTPQREPSQADQRWENPSDFLQKSQQKNTHNVFMIRNVKQVIPTYKTISHNQSNIHNTKSMNPQPNCQFLEGYQKQEKSYKYLNDSPLQIGMLYQNRKQDSNVQIFRQQKKIFQSLSPQAVRNNKSLFVNKQSVGGSSLKRRITPAKTALTKNSQGSQNYIQQQPYESIQPKSSVNSPSKEHREYQLSQLQVFKIESESCRSFEMENNQSDHSFEELEQQAECSGKHVIQFSQFANRTPTFFCQYPPICQKQRKMARTRPMTEEEIEQYQPVYRLYGQVPYKCVVNAFEAAGFALYDESEEEDELCWNIMWGIASKVLQKSMNKFQKVNHFPGCWNIGRKDNLWINLSKLKRKYPQDYAFIPTTYLLAYDYDRFLLQREQAPKHQLWIIKPVAAARGCGIKIVTKKSKIKKTKNYLVMEYIQTPHLINQLKYDLRIYVLISSFDPLRIYLYQEGLVRFATEKYSTHKSDLSKKYIHLTNFAVNKSSPNYKKNLTSKDAGSSKWSLSEYKEYISSIGVNTEAIFAEIKDIVVKTCIGCEPFMLDSNAKSLEHKSNYFELYGFDVIVDSQLKPWLLEVNVCPSLNSASPLDKVVKTGLISDIIHLIGVPLWDKSKKSKSQTFSPQPKHDRGQSFSRNLNEIPNINLDNCLSKLSPEDWNAIMTTLEEKERLGNFECIYPDPQTIKSYSKFFGYQRYSNKLIERFYQDNQTWIQKLPQ